MPDLVDIPEEFADTAILQRNAEWAGMFPERGTTNLARRRYEFQQQDKASYNAALERQRAAAMQRKFDTDRTFQAARQTEQKMSFAEQLHPQVMELNEARIRNEQIKTATAVAAEKRKLEREAVMIQHGDAMDAELGAIPPGTRDFALKAAQALIKYPGAPIEQQRSVRALAKIPEDVTPEEALAQLGAARAAFKDATISGKVGSVRVTDNPAAPPKPKDEEAAMYKRLTHLENERDGTKDADVKAYVDSEIIGMRAKLGLPPAPNTPGASAAPATTAQPAAPAVATPSADITPEAHAALKPGETFWWKGKQLTKK